MAINQRTSRKTNSPSLLGSQEGQLALLVALADDLPRCRKMNVEIGGKMTAIILFENSTWKNGELEEIDK